MKTLSLKSPTKTLATVGPKTIDAKVEVLPSRQLSTEVRGKKGGEIVLKKGEKGGSVVVSGGDKSTTNSQDDGSRRGNANAAGTSTLKGLVRADRMVELLTRVAKYSLAEAESTIREHVLSWSNKRKRQTLAEGGTVQRRLRGTGFDGQNNKGFTKGGKAGKADDSKAGEPSQSSEDFAETVRKRWAKKPAGDLPTVTDGRAKPLPLDAPAKAKPLALGEGERMKPLRLGDGPKAKSTGAMGFASDAGAALKEQGKEAVGVGLDNTLQGLALKTAKAVAAADLKRVKALWNSGERTQAVTLASKYYVPGAAGVNDAVLWIERRLGL